eukprot:scaffold4013_cov13-Tisochrysis_lutea.AAC.1
MLQVVASSLGGARQQALCIAARQLVQPVVWQQQQTSGFSSEGGGPKRVSSYNLFVKVRLERAVCPGTPFDRASVPLRQQRTAQA